MDLMRMFNKFAGENKSDIRKALDTSVGSGAGLIPQKLEQVITNAMVRLSPEIAMVQPEYDAQKTHEFNRTTALPAAGGAMGEGSVTPTRNSVIARDSIGLKVIKRKGAVTGFLQDASKKYRDATAVEMENHVLAHSFDLATYMLYGNGDANTYEFSGLDTFITTNRKQASVASAVPTTLSFLDEMIDVNIQKQGANHKQAFIMSPQMLSKVSALLSNVRLTQNVGALTKVDVDGGWRMNAYRDIPIICSSAVRPQDTMTTVTAASGGTTTGTLSDGTYYFSVAPITYNGEELASAAATVTLSGGGSTQWIALSWAAFAGAIGYKVYYGTTSTVTDMNLIRRIAAQTYDSAGTITGDVVGVNLLTVAAGAEVPTAARTDHPYVVSGGNPPETVILWDLDKYQGLGKLAYSNSGGSRFEGLASLEPLAKTDDNFPFMIKSYAALVPSFEATSFMRRGIRVA